MMHITIFSGHQGQMRRDRKFYLTLFGGCSVTRPTTAREIIAGREDPERGKSAPFCLTLFGGFEIKHPSLAEEFVDLRDALRSGTLTPQVWEQSMATLTQYDGTPSSFTIFGGFSEEVPDEKEEVDALAIHMHMGNIDETTSRLLQLAIGRPQSDRLATVYRAVQQSQSTDGT